MDANPAAALTAAINWGDGSPSTVVNLPAGSYAFSVPHDYSTESASKYNIGVTLSDGTDTAYTQTPLNISYPSPEFAAPGLVLSSTSIDENGSVTVSGTVVSPGGIHTNTVSINWGDGGQATSIVLSPGEYQFSASHTYASSPAGVASGNFSIAATVVDENGKVGTASAP